ncbi:MAG: hypothetical protein JXR48_01915 [Candidatus Delongbacteria bacterium]|nr:hypothetical protein [Candidatus Delongbacteria bacterium]
MKNKKALYILIPSVILIWGLIAFKIFTYSTEEELITNVKILDVKHSFETQIDTFTLSLNYDDPFLKTTSKSTVFKTQAAEKTNQNTNQSKQKITNSEKNNKEKNTIKWPAIRYDGLIKNNSSGTVTGILVIDGTTRLIQQGSIIDNIIIQNISETEVRLKYLEETKTIFKGK